MGAESYCVLTHTPDGEPSKTLFGSKRWSLVVYSWPGPRVSPGFRAVGPYATAQEAVLAGIATYGRVYRADAEYDTVWSAAWPQTDRKKASPGEVSAAEEAWRGFVRDLEEISGENQSVSE